MIIESYIGEDDCLIHVTHYEPYIPAFTSGPPEDCSPAEGGYSEWQVLNPLGERDTDLESRLTTADRDRIGQLIVEKMEQAYDHEL